MNVSVTIDFTCCQADFRASITAEHPHCIYTFPFPLLRRLHESGMNSTKEGSADEFKVPSTIPQDLLLIHDLVGEDLPQASPSSRTHTAGMDHSSVTRAAQSGESDTDSIASSSGEDSLDEAGDVNMLKADVPMEEEVDKGGDSEEEVEAGLLDKDEGGDPMTM